MALKHVHLKTRCKLIFVNINISKYYENKTNRSSKFKVLRFQQLIDSVNSKCYGWYL